MEIEIKQAKKSKGGKAKRVIDKPIIYTIKDKAFGEFQVKNSPNAWWLERGKVELLIGACKIDASVNECCYQAGITPNQYQYFYEQHPNFSIIKEVLNESPNLKARQTVVKALDNPDYAFKYLEKKRKKEFGNALDLTTGGEKLPQPILNVLPNNSDKENKESDKKD